MRLTKCPLHQGLGRKLLMYFIEMSVVAFSILSIVCLLRTFGDIEEPVVLREPAVVYSQPVTGSDDRTHEVHITRDITYRDVTPVLIITQLINKDINASIDLNDTKITAERLGTFQVHKLYYVSHLTSGNWCLKSTMYWTPSLSFRERSITTPEACFVVK